MPEPQPTSMRERTRRLAQTELTSVAQDLFLEHGYENTTVDQIAAAAGMSRRTFFRYFASKDDLVIGKYDLFGDRLADAFADRPRSEPVWDSLRRVFDLTLDYVEDSHARARNDAMDRIVRDSPQLNARYLEKMQRVQQMLVGQVAGRLPPGVAGSEDAKAAAIVGAAFACMQAARIAWLESDRRRPFAEVLDDVMSAFQLT